MSASNKRLTAFCAASMLLTWSTSVYADMSVSCNYEVLTASYEYLAACGVEISPGRYETYKRLRTVLKDFINLNSAPDKPRIDSAYDESHRKRILRTAQTEKCQGETRQFTQYIFESWTTEQFATRLFGKLSNSHDPDEGDCL